MTHGTSGAPGRRNIRLLVEYDGTPFLGWQHQPQGPTVQSALEDAIARITGERSRVRGAGRTDAGVHALGQVGAFRTGTSLETEALRRGLNAVLPQAVSVLAADDVPEDFDPRFSALLKVYRYHVFNRPSPSPLLMGRVWHIHRALDIESMKACGPILLGKKDFSSFRASGCSAADPVRDLFSLDISNDVENVCFELAADGFLRHMVRNVVGTIVQVGLGRFSTAAFHEILEARDRCRAGVTAPPWGLYLVRVEYPPRYGNLHPAMPHGPGPDRALPTRGNRSRS